MEQITNITPQADFSAEQALALTGERGEGLEQDVHQTEELADLIKQLPIKLRAGISVEALKAALQEGLVEINEDGHWEWIPENKTLLAYFCGRMWCGDTPLYSNHARAYVWQYGSVKFPKKDLVTLFGVTNLRVLRARRFLGLLPVGWEIVERIFQKKTQV